MAKASPIDTRERCDRCGHVWSFHQKRRGAECRAMGCSVTYEKRGKKVTGRCPGFVRPEQA